MSELHPCAGEEERADAVRVWDERLQTEVSQLQDAGTRQCAQIEGRKEMFYLTTHSKHFIYGYMVKDHSDSEKGNPLLPHRLLLSINSKGSFICAIPQTG